MLSRRLFSWFRSIPPRGACAGSKCQTRLGLEALEDRCVPTTFTVTLGTDAGGVGGVSTGPNAGDLRYCVNQANLSGAGSDMIVFSPLVHTVSLTHGFGGVALSITDPQPLTIEATNGTVVISGTSSFGIFSIAAASNVTFSNLQMTHGLSAANGGAIFNQGTAALINCTLANNSAANGGAIAANGAATTLTGCTLDQNSATSTGGGIFSTGGALTMTNSTLDSNSAATDAGGIYNAGPATLINCTITRNGTNVNGGGIFNQGTLNLTNDLIALNTAAAGGPDVENLGIIQTASHNLAGVDDGSSALGILANGVNGNQVGSPSKPINPVVGPLANNRRPDADRGPAAGQSRHRHGRRLGPGLPQHRPARLAAKERRPRRYRRL